MPTGTVKWFNNAKGFGFILPDEGEGDLFAHYSSIEMDGYKTLKAGQAVSFTIADTDKGGHAKNIQVVGAEPSPTSNPPQTDQITNSHTQEELDAQPA